jgi:hypothetical protein
MDDFLAGRSVLMLLGCAALYLVCGAAVTAAAWREVYPGARAAYLALARNRPDVPLLSEAEIRRYTFALGCATWPWLVVQELVASLPSPWR